MLSVAAEMSNPRTPQDNREPDRQQRQRHDRSVDREPTIPLTPFHGAHDPDRDLNRKEPQQDRVKVLRDFGVSHFAPQRNREVATIAAVTTR